MSRVTVIMPVYNGEPYLAEAIESILGQRFDDLDFVIVDDGSTDRSAEIARSYRDPRIQLLHNPSNLGLIATLNRALDVATGEYVARMDADDVSFPDRLAKQVAFLDANPDTGVCGAGVVYLGAAERRVNGNADPDFLACALLFNNPLAHPTVVLRSSVLRRHGLRYDPDYPHAEDYELWTRCAQVTRITSVAEPLLGYRAHPGCITRTHSAALGATTNRVRRRQVTALGIEPTDAEMALHASIAGRRFQATEEYLVAVERWLARLAAANHERPRFPQRGLARRLLALWRLAVSFAASRGACDGSRFVSSPLLDALDLPPVERALVARRRRRSSGPDAGGG